LWAYNRPRVSEVAEKMDSKRPVANEGGRMVGRECQKSPKTWTAGETRGK
jgi:hypothetical protein